MKLHKISISKKKKEKKMNINQQPIPQTIKIGEIQYAALLSNFSSNSKFIVLFIYSIDVSKHLLLTNPSLKRRYAPLLWRLAGSPEARWHSTNFSA